METNDEKIIQLSSEVVDQIAAGEVVERPSHMVKELVENSIDAGATRIEVQFEQGGRFVRVTDNGLGMSPKDLEKALDRHATSKISKTDDLWSLNTFGFRGEALASISAVSRMTLRSRRENDESAVQLQSDFGKRSPIDPVGGNVGTMVQIEELFANTPARLKFLKSDSAESVQIKNVLKALALAHPRVEFKISQGSDLIFYWPQAQSRIERAKQVLEIENLYEGTASRSSSLCEVRAYSVFADPNTTAKTARNIWIFAQNRWIQDKSIQAAVTEAYRSLLMHGEYPIAIAWVETNPEFVDVNIHPTKSQVKFADINLAFRAVQASIRDTLETAPWLNRFLPQNQTPSTQVGVNSFLNSDSSVTSEVGFGNKSSNTHIENLSFESAELDKTQYNKKETQKYYTSERAELLQRLQSQPEQGQVVVSSNKHQVVSAGKWSQLEVLGQAYLTYIICQSREALLLVDQHAAHERVAYEKLMHAWRGGKIEVQDFLFPLSVDLSPDKVEALMSQVQEILRLGVHLEQLGPSTVGVKAAPLILKESILANVLDKMATEALDQGGSYRLEKTIGDICATMACHSVVRAGQALSMEQMKSLLQEMDEFPMSSFCPHGRPVYVEYPFYKIEKDFGRIV